MCPSAPRVCSEPGGQRPELSLSLDLIGGEHGQAQNRVNFDFGVQFDLEGYNQSSHKTIGILTKVFYISGPNLVILA